MINIYSDAASSRYTPVKFNSAEDMSDDILIKKLGISFHGPGYGKTPREHQETFNHIRAIKNKKLEDYLKEITIENNEASRKQQTYVRAKEIADRAPSLVKQRRNEAGWRFSLEPFVFHRFQIEPCNCWPEHRPGDS